MEIQKVVGIALITAGALGLAYGGFTYTKESHQADIGALHLAINETDHVNIPVWASIGVIAFGGMLVLVGFRKN